MRHMGTIGPDAAVHQPSRPAKAERRCGCCGARVARKGEAPYSLNTLSPKPGPLRTAIVLRMTGALVRTRVCARCYAESTTLTALREAMAGDDLRIVGES